MGTEQLRWPSRALGRPALERRLDELLTRRLGLIVADGGFGKSLLAAVWSERVAVAWHEVSVDDREMEVFAGGLVGALRRAVPDLPADLAATMSLPRGPDAAVEEAMRARATAALLAQELDAQLGEHLVLVLDDAHELGAASGSWRLIESLVRQAGPCLHILLLSRAEPPFGLERLRGRGEVLELTGRDLAFTAAEVRALAQIAVVEACDGLVAEVHQATGGWPVAVRFALEMLAGTVRGERRPILQRMRRRGSPVFAYFAREVFEAEPEHVRRLLRSVAALERFTPALCDALRLPSSQEALDSLVPRGLFVEPDRGEPGWYRLSALARDLMREHFPLAPDELREVRRRAAHWLEWHGRPVDASRALAAAKEHDELSRLLAEHGEAMISAGDVEAVSWAARAVPVAARDATVDKLAGHAHLIRGEFESALACFERVGAPTGALEAGIAWRMGLIHHLRGELDEADAIYRRGRVEGAPPRDASLLLAWRSTVEWLRGDADASREHAEAAFRVASASADPQALAAAHNALAMQAALEGDRVANRSHYVRALENAERAGDLLQIVRIRNNRASHYLEEGCCDEALEDLAVALRLADVAGFAHLRALALNNRGLTRFMLGRLEEATGDLEESRNLYRRLGSRNVAYPLGTLGDVHQERGDFALARGAYEEALADARRARDVQSLGYVLSGLARVLVREEPDVAAKLADEALALGPGMAHVRTLTAAAIVALERGESGRAAELAAEAAAVARARRDSNGLAEALELRARAAPDDAARGRLEEAIAIFRETGNPLGEARAELTLARLLDPLEGRALAASAEARLRALGAREHAAAAAAVLAELDRRPGTAIRVESLGRFRVLRDGVPVPLTEWRSKKARDLFKLLVARRGRAAPRDALMEALWPGEDPTKLANRLSVALSTIRAILDPGRQSDPEAFIASGRHAVALEVGALEVDLEQFFAAAEAGQALLREGRVDAARERLLAAEAIYAGDFLEEDAYEDWAAPVREEARGTYIQVVRALAQDASAAGDFEAAQRYLLRLLEKDPFDESAHLALVAALRAGRRHGDARRAYRAYAARMEELGVEAAPFEPGGADRPRPLGAASVA